MKKVITVFALSFAIVTVITVFSALYDSRLIEESFLRLHIRADSNDKDAQEIKLTVRDAVLSEVDLLLKNAKSRDEAKTIVSNNLERITACADKSLKAQGVDYRSSATVGQEYFPTRDYDSYMLPAGKYESLIIRLGSGSGNNWWCVLYPSLCKGGIEITDTVLTEDGYQVIKGDGKVSVKFKLIEIINKIKETFS